MPQPFSSCEEFLRTSVPKSVDFLPILSRKHATANSAISIASSQALIDFDDVVGMFARIVTPQSPQFLNFCSLHSAPPISGALYRTNSNYYDAVSSSRTLILTYAARRTSRMQFYRHGS